MGEPAREDTEPEPDAVVPPPPPPPPLHPPDHHPASTGSHPPRAHDVAERRHHRRRRRAGLLPPLPAPADIPEDAPGRVEILAMEVVSPVPVRPPAPPRTPSRGTPLPIGGWEAVAALAAVLVVVFVVGLLATR